MSAIRLMKFRDEFAKNDSPLFDGISESRFTISQLEKIKRPFVIFSNFYLLEKNINVLKELVRNKNLKAMIYTVDTRLHTLSGQFLEQELQKPLLKKMRPVEDITILSRIYHSWDIGAQADLVADFKVNRNGEFYLLGCDSNIYSGNLSLFPFFEKASFKEFSNYHISKLGNRITWPSLGIDLDIFSFKAKLVKKYQGELLKKRLKYYSDLGDRLKILRESRGILQSGFEDLSDKQIRRYEKNEGLPTLQALEKMARAYDMDEDELVETLSNIL